VLLSRSVARLRLRDSKALERLQVLRSKPSTHFSTHLLTVVMGENAIPEFAYNWLYIEHPHTGLIHPGFIHGRYASQRMRLVALLALSFIYSEEACSEE